MFAIVVGAALGFLIGAVSQALLAWNSGRFPTRHDILTAGICGLVAGAISAATLGIGSGPAATVGMSTIRGMTAGALGNGSGRATRNYLDDIPLGDGIPESLLAGASAGVPTGSLPASLATTFMRSTVEQAAENFEEGQPLGEGVIETGMTSLSTGMLRKTAAGRGINGRLAEVKDGR